MVTDLVGAIVQSITSDIHGPVRAVSMHSTNGNRLVLLVEHSASGDLFEIDAIDTRVVNAREPS